MPADGHATAASSGPAITPNWTAARTGGRRQAVDGRVPGAGNRADRHRQPEGRLQQGLRLLHRSLRRPAATRARRLHSQADAQERRTLHHAGTEGVRRASPVGRREGEVAGVRTVRAPCARPCMRLRGACRRPPLSLAQLDVLSGLAELAIAAPLRPTRAGRRADRSNIIDGRHPVLDILEPQGTFVPNDTVADPQGGIDPADHRPEHGGQEHLHPAGRAADTAWPRSAASCPPRRP